jgi:type IV pilus assembly protein PilV
MVIRYGKFASGRAERGVTLIEVLVTVAVTSVGLLGMAGMMAMSAKVNYAAYQRTQAGLIAQALIESMHINASAVAQGRYDGTYTGNSMLSHDCRQHGCSALERADYDRANFDRSLAATLPNLNATMKCNAGAGSTVASIYDGVCRLQVDWSERPFAKNTDTTPQTLVWVFQP